MSGSGPAAALSCPSLPGSSMPGQGHAPPRDIPDSGGFAELARDCGVTGATPNPTIVANAITSSDRYHSLGGCTISTLKRARRCCADHPDWALPWRLAPPVDAGPELQERRRQPSPCLGSYRGLTVDAVAVACGARGHA